jgi:hypothetical protein
MTALRRLAGFASIVLAWEGFSTFNNDLLETNTPSLLVSDRKIY